MQQRRKPVHTLHSIGIGILILMLCSIADPVFAREPSPGDIEQAIQTRLKREKGVPGHLIEVTVNEGTAVLTGTVDNLLARERATTVAESIRGVRAVVNRIEVLPANREDSALKADVEAALALDSATDELELEVRVQNGEVILSGNVDSWAEKRLSEKVAKGVAGVWKLTDTIDVESRSRRPDREIQEEIRERLAWDVWIDDALIDVAVEDGTVRLSGFAGSLLEKSRAFNKARVSGVKSVNAEELIVNPLLRNDMRKGAKYQAKPDEKIEAALRAAFRNDPRVLPFNVEAMVEEGVVTLTGVVDNLQAKCAAARDAENTMGVWRVRNFLRVRPDRIADDETLENRIQQALKRSPDVYRSADVDIDVANGKAVLHGSVDSRFEAERIEAVVSGVKGMVEVDNNLEVPENSEAETPDVAESDRKLKENVESELRWNPYVDEERIIVTVEDGVVTLAGNVNSIRELNVAARNAREAGAAEVVNLLDFEYGPPRY